MDPALPLKLAHLKRRAAEELQRGNHAAAAERYTEAAGLLLPPTQQQLPPPPHLRLAPAAASELRALLSNRSLAWLKAGRAAAAAEDAAAVVALAPAWPKGYWRLGKALVAQLRWADAVDALLAAWCLSEAGSEEATDCEVQLLAAVQRLTRQELADGLLQALLQQQLPAAPSVACALQLRQGPAPLAPAADGAAVGTGVQESALARSIQAAAGPRSEAAAGWLQQHSPEELREGLFLIVKQQQQQAAASRLEPTPPQALLLKCLLLRAAHTSDGAISRRVRQLLAATSSTNSSSLGDIVCVELLLLAARLAVLLQAWGEAQAAAAAAQHALSKLVLPNEGQVLHLLLECHTTLGDALAAGGTSSQRSPCRRPSEAALAYLAALDLLPAAMAASENSKNGSSGSSVRPSSKLPLLPLLLRGPAGAAQDSNAMRRQVQAKLDAALEVLSDSQQAAVWARAAAARGAASTRSGSLHPALMQLGLVAATAEQQQQQQKQQVLVVTLTVRRRQAAGSSGEPGSRREAPLSGLARVQLLSALAAAAGVARTAVGLAHLQAAASPTAALTPAAVGVLTVKVQFGGDAAAAEQFLAACSSIESLLAACPDLAGLLLASGGSAQPDVAAEPDTSVAAVACCYDVAAHLTDMLQPESLAADTNSSHSRSSEKPGTSTALSAATAGEVTVPTAPPSAIPLPYAHYQLETEDGRPLERPDKHPFGLARVLTDARELPDAAAEVWFAAADGTHRWRQTASSVLLQLHVLPPHVTRAKQLRVSVEPQAIRVWERGVGHGEGLLLFEAPLARGVVPEESTWVFVGGSLRGSQPEQQQHQQQQAATILEAPAPSGSALVVRAPQHQGLPLSAVPVSSSSSTPSCHLLFELSKMNLELLERPWQHSASWWPRLFADDAADVAADDGPKDYTDLPGPIAAQAAAAAERDEAARRQQEALRRERAKLQALVDAHKRARAERLQQLRAAAWGGAGSSSSSRRAGRRTGSGWGGVEPASELHTHEG